MKPTNLLRLVMLLSLAALLLTAGCGDPRSPVMPPDTEPEDTSFFDVISTTSTRGFAGDMDYENGMLYVAETSAGVGEYDASDLSNITLSRRVEFGDEVTLVDALPEMNMLFVNVVSTTEALFLDSLIAPPDAGFGDFNINRIISTTAFDTVTSQFLVPPDTFHTDVARVLYSDWSDGLVLWTVFKDTSNILRQTYISSSEEVTINWTNGPEYGVTTLDDFYHVATGLQDYGVVFADISPATWETGGLKLSDVDTPGEARMLDYEDGYVYVADGLGGLAVIDVQDIMAPELVASWKIEGLDHADNIVVRGDVAALVDRFDGVYFIDISDPTKPALLDAYEVREPVDVIFVEDDKVLVSSKLVGISALQLIFPSE